MEGGRAERSGGIPMETHRAIEGAVGLALVVVPIMARFGFQTETVLFSGPSIAVCAVLGALAAMLGFAGTRDRRDASGRSHASFDRIVLGAAILAMIVFALLGELPPVLLLGAAAMAYGVLVTLTRYPVR